MQRLEEDGSLVVEQRSFDALRGRLTTAFVIIAPDGLRRDSVGHGLRLYTLTELCRMLDAAGLALLRVYGGVSGDSYALDSLRMTAVISR